MRLLLPISVLALVSACASAPRPPSPAAEATPPPWYSDPAAAGFPPAHYVVGTGEGSSARAAKDRATAEIARFFEARVESREEITERYRESDTATSSELTANRATRIGTSQILKGVEVARVEAVGGRTFALAVLDRRAALRRLKAGYEDDQRALARAAEMVDAGGRDRATLGAVASGLKATQRMRQTLARSRVLDPGALQADPAMAARETALREHYDELRASLVATRVVVEAPDDLAAGVRELISSALASEDVPTAAADAPYELRVRVTTEPGASDGRWVRWAWTWAAELRERGSSAAAGSWSNTGKSAHVDASRARTATLRDLRTDFERVALFSIVEILYGSSDASRGENP